MSKETFRNIGLIGRPGKASVVQTLEVLERYLVDAGAKVIYDEDTARLMPAMSQQVCSRALMGEMCDLVIVVRCCTRLASWPGSRRRCWASIADGWAS